MKYSLLIILALCNSAFAQINGSDTSKVSTKNEGIDFLMETEWNRVLEIAKNQNKLIFIDFYATWCAPCKMMDRTTYLKKEVGLFAHEHYVSIKLQTDSTLKDDKNVKENYSLSKHFVNQYNIRTLPTFLILTPDGKALHRDGGFKDVDEFIAFLKEGLKPQTQFYSQLAAYNTGHLEVSKMGVLAIKVSTLLRDKQLAQALALKYINEYLAGLSDNEMLHKQNLSFISSWTRVITSHDKYFSLFLSHGKIIDSIMNYSGLAERTVATVIAREELNENGNTEKWQQYERKIKKKYGSRLATRVVQDAKIGYYLSVKEWPNAIKEFFTKNERLGLDSSTFGLLGVNNFLYDVVLSHSKNKVYINRGLQIAAQVIRIAPSDVDYIDTYASFLYRSGNRQKAIFWQNKATVLDPENIEVKAKLDKMKMGIDLSK